MTTTDAPTAQHPTVPRASLTGHSHRPGGDDLHPVFGWRLIPVDLRVPDTWWPPRRQQPIDGPTAVIPTTPTEKGTN